MKRRLAITGAVVAAVALMGSVDTAKADHNRSSCRPGFSSYGYSNGYSYSPSRSYYYRPSYGYSNYSYYRPSYGFSYARPGFSLSIGRGGVAFGRSRTYGHSFYNRGRHFHRR